MVLKVLIVDDEALARQRLKNLLADCNAPSAQVIGEAANVHQALHCVLQQMPDLVLADIHMPGEDGLTLAQRLAKLAQTPALVFVTAHAQHALKAFDLAALDYLTKPVRLERLQTALQKVERFIQAKQGPSPNPNPVASEEFLLIQERGSTLRLALDDVLYLKAELKYITVRTAKRTYILEGSLSELELRHAKHFLRIHRNALVARQAVRALQKQQHPTEGTSWTLHLEQLDEPLLVSRRQLRAVKALLEAG